MLESLGQTDAAAFAGFAESALIILGFQNQRSDRVRLAIFVNRNECHVGAGGVFALSG